MERRDMLRCGINVFRRSKIGDILERTELLKEVALANYMRISPGSSSFFSHATRRTLFTSIEGARRTLATMKKRQIESPQHRTKEGGTREERTAKQLQRSKSADTSKAGRGALRWLHVVIVPISELSFITNSVMVELSCPWKIIVHDKNKGLCTMTFGDVARHSMGNTLFAGVPREGNAIKSHLGPGGKKEKENERKKDHQTVWSM